MSWELHCPSCWRSSWDGKLDDEHGDRCPVCGQLPALDALSDAESFERDQTSSESCERLRGRASASERRLSDSRSPTIPPRDLATRARAQRLGESLLALPRSPVPRLTLA